jgi:DNA repair exonuclease SbcCD ATPase subunit
MSNLTDRLRELYVQNGTNYVQEAADEIDRLRVTVKMLQDDKAALRETQAKFGQVQHDLLSQIDALQVKYEHAVEQAAKNADEVLALREQLALAESVRAAQVAGLTEGAEKLRKEVARLTKIIDDAWGDA